MLNQSSGSQTETYLMISGFVLAIIIIVILFALFILPIILYKLKILAKAKRDYRTARGTFHLKQLEKSHKQLKKALEKYETKISDHRRQLVLLEYKKSIQFKRALTIHLVKTRLTEIDGIGPILRDRIISECFDGTLESLTKAQYLNGIGAEKMWTINNWRDRIRGKLPQLLEVDFPKKTKIENEFYPKIEQIKSQMIENATLVGYQNKLEKYAIDEIERLRKVTISQFYKSYKGNNSASKAVNEYLKGSFPEWGSMPEWFETLIKNYGE